MSLLLHALVLGVLVVDLIFASTVVDDVMGRRVAIGLEFALILGYVIFVLQWGVPWGRRDSDDGR